MPKQDWRRPMSSTIATRPGDLDRNRSGGARRCAFSLPAPEVLTGFTLGVKAADQALATALDECQDCRSELLLAGREGGPIA